jgi:hypothetical protein
MGDVSTMIYKECQIHPKPNVIPIVNRKIIQKQPMETQDTKESLDEIGVEILAAPLSRTSSSRRPSNVSVEKRLPTKNMIDDVVKDRLPTKGMIDDVVKDRLPTKGMIDDVVKDNAPEEGKETKKYFTIERFVEEYIDYLAPRKDQCISESELMVILTVKQSIEEEQNVVKSQLDDENNKIVVEDDCFSV